MIKGVFLDQYLIRDV